MLAQILALMAAAAPAQDPTTVVSPVTVSPSPDKAPITATVDQRTDQQTPWGGDFTAIWPAGALNAGVDGRVVLSCLIDAHGLAESCKVAKETPAGKRLGAAALEMRPTFKLKPATGADGQPVSAMMNISVRFTSPNAQFDNQYLMDQLYKTSCRLCFGTLNMPPGGGGAKIVTRDETMMDNPIWADAASFEDLAAAYPAKGGGVEGYAAAHCRVERNGDKAGTLRDCQIIKETPGGHDFGKAALALATKFRADPAAMINISSHAPIWVDIPMRLPPPEGGTAEHLVTAPHWITTLDPKVLLKLFPPEAAAKGLSDGEGVARCNVAGDGSLTGCEPEAGEPDGLGFSELTARIASRMRMNLWSADGAPVDGGVVRIPIRFKLPEAR
jgi:TonB family protein